MKLKKSSKAEKTQTRWINPVLQGIAHWVGYKKQFYNGHLLNEGSLVSEITSLMNAYMNYNQRIDCELRYSVISSNFKGNERADIVQFTNDKIGFIIEVKRYESGRRLIETDIKKLNAIKSINKNIRCCLLIISQGSVPSLLVSEKGNAYKQKFTITGSEIKYKIIRVCKSVSSFREDAYLKANYACLIELL